MTLPATLQNLVNSLEQVTQRSALTGSDLPYIKMDKTGVWCYGADETEVEVGSQWAINPNSLATGFACWGDGEKIDEAMALITEPPVLKSSLPQHGPAWNEQVGFQIACVSGSDKGQQCIYGATSKGARKAFAELVNAILAEARKGSDKIVPIVELDATSYKHKQYGKVYTPVFDIVGWAALEDTAAEAEAPETEPEEKPEPQRRRRRQA